MKVCSTAIRYPAHLNYNYFVQTTAPCLSNGVTDCNECSNAADCPPIPSTQCYCTSECYRNGMCCPDVGHLQNCLGNGYNSCCVLIFPNTYVAVWSVYTEEECEIGEVRLVGGVDNSSSGVLEVCANGGWGTVCDYRNEWYYENAVVVCRQLNLPTSSQFTKQTVVNEFAINSVDLHLLGARIVPSSMFNSVLNHVVLLDDVYCIGNEDTLLDCSHSTIGNHLCGQFLLQDETSHIAVQCQGAH